MDHRPKSGVKTKGHAAIPWPLKSKEWNEVVDALGLSPQQTKIVELVILGKKDKQIATSLGLKRSTIRTHLRRILNYLKIMDRVELSLRVFASVCQQEMN